MKLGLSRIGKHEVLFPLEHSQLRRENYKRFRDVCYIRSDDFPEAEFYRRFGETFRRDIQCVEDLVETVTEDICVLQPDSMGDYRLRYALVLFPNRWRPREKLGLTLPEIHSPVPGFSGAVRNLDLFLKHLDPRQYYRRQNWGLAQSDSLYLPYNIEGQDTFERVEYQTLFKLEPNFLVFLIRTVVSPAKPDTMNLAAGLSEDTKKYKFHGSLLARL